MPTPIEIFKPGRHVDMHGKVVEFSEADCAACAAAYDPALHEAPIVIGHPKHDSPAYGWIKTLSFADNSMQALPAEIDPAFAEAVSVKKQYKKVSASFYTPNSPSNPKPGVYYLRHVGFLGAQPPGVKGLRQVSFAEDSSDVVTVQFGDYLDRNVASGLRSLRDWILSKFGLDEADKALPSWVVNVVQEEAAQPETSVPVATGFSEGTESSGANVGAVTPEVVPSEAAQPPVSATPPAPAPLTEAVPPVATPPAVDPRQAELDAREADLKRREDELKKSTAERDAKQLEARHGEHVAYLEGLVRDGRPLPCAPEMVVSFMRLLDGEQSDVVSFGESEARTPLELFKTEFLGRLPQTVQFGEFAGGTFNDDSSPAAIAAAAKQYQDAQRKSGNEISISDAVTHVMRSDR